MDIISDKREQFIQYCLEKDNNFPHILPVIFPNKTQEAILIEFRLLPHISFLIKNTIYQLGNNWSHTIVCGLNNYEFILNLVGMLDRNIKIIKIPVENLTREEYSIMLLKSSFYRRFSGEKLLFYQEDSIILKPLDSKFFKYDFIGAPYSNYHVGNGGLSLRTKNVMIEICEKYFDPWEKELSRNAKILNRYKPKIIKRWGNRYFDNPNLYFIYLIEKNLLEDLQITNIMREKNIGKLPSFEEAKKFSIEKFYEENAFGGHQFWYCVSNLKKWLDRKLRY